LLSNACSKAEAAGLSLRDQLRFCIKTLGDLKQQPPTAPVATPAAAGGNESTTAPISDRRTQMYNDLHRSLESATRTVAALLVRSCITFKNTFKASFHA
jgi:hypothetical protein